MPGGLPAPVQGLSLHRRLIITRQVLTSAKTMRGPDGHCGQKSSARGGGPRPRWGRGPHGRRTTMSTVQGRELGGNLGSLGSGSTSGGKERAIPRRLLHQACFSQRPAQRPLPQGQGCHSLVARHRPLVLHSRELAPPCLSSQIPPPPGLELLPPLLCRWLSLPRQQIKVPSGTHAPRCLPQACDPGAPTHPRQGEQTQDLPREVSTPGHCFPVVSLCPPTNGPSQGP